MERAQTRASYEVRIGRVVDFIHAHLEDEIRVDRLADVACLSAYHWHRIYTAMRGETVAATVRRLRLTRAADRLANSRMAIGDIAERARYGSSDAFARAFREAYGLPPADYRARGSHALFSAASRADDAAGFPVTVEVLAPQPCAAVAHDGPYTQVDRAMGQLFSMLGAGGLLVPDQPMLAVYFDDPDLVPAEALRAKACTPIGADIALAPPLERFVIAGGRYARLRHKGPYAAMKEAYRWLFGVWLPQSGKEAADAPVFEAYLNAPSQVPPTELLTDIHLPLATDA
ncbi:AraC family transcriptional regulator [Chelatococcus reniformis]|uniref:AraC family transcriptional regulator n=1 Tax=Chelatococcus reniformis TaxID=1494448 RepID=A0A916U5P3_9HYPH|nr:GyrI-like domain-containing protein [Chelatococcus reniformis]GGC60161.1 AraC family transcriptional regulator [Chelatococcus reniformis]